MCVSRVGPSRRAAALTDRNGRQAHTHTQMPKMETGTRVSPLWRAQGRGARTYAQEEVAAAAVGVASDKDEIGKGAHGMDLCLTTTTTTTATATATSVGLTHPRRGTSARRSFGHATRTRKRPRPGKARPACDTRIDVSGRRLAGFLLPPSQSRRPTSEHANSRLVPHCAPSHRADSRLGGLPWHGIGTLAVPSHQRHFGCGNGSAVPL